MTGKEGWNHVSEQVFLVGRLGRDPEVRYTGGGQAVANFSLATDESYKDREGEKHTSTEIVAGEMKMLDSKKESEGDESQR